MNKVLLTIIAVIMLCCIGAADAAEQYNLITAPKTLMQHDISIEGEGMGQNKVGQVLVRSSATLNFPNGANIGISGAGDVTATSRNTITGVTADGFSIEGFDAGSIPAGIKFEYNENTRMLKFTSDANGKEFNIPPLGKFKPVLTRGQALKVSLDKGEATIDTPGELKLSNARGRDIGALTGNLKVKKNGNDVEVSPKGMTKIKLPWFSKGEQPISFEDKIAFNPDKPEEGVKVHGTWSSRWKIGDSEKEFYYNKGSGKKPCTIKPGQDRVEVEWPSTRDGGGSVIIEDTCMIVAKNEKARLKLFETAKNGRFYEANPGNEGELVRKSANGDTAVSAKGGVTSEASQGTKEGESAKKKPAKKASADQGSGKKQTREGPAVRAKEPPAPRPEPVDSKHQQWFKNNQAKVNEVISALQSSDIAQKDEWIKAIRGKDISKIRAMQSIVDQDAINTAADGYPGRGTLAAINAYASKTYITEEEEEPAAPAKTKPAPQVAGLGTKASEKVKIVQQARTEREAAILDRARRDLESIRMHGEPTLPPHSVAEEIRQRDAQELARLRAENPEWQPSPTDKKSKNKWDELVEESRRIIAQRQAKTTPAAQKSEPAAASQATAEEQRNIEYLKKYGELPPPAISIAEEERRKTQEEITKRWKEYPDWTPTEAERKTTSTWEEVTAEGKKYSVQSRKTESGTIREALSQTPPQTDTRQSFESRPVASMNANEKRAAITQLIQAAPRSIPGVSDAEYKAFQKILASENMARSGQAALETYRYVRENAGTPTGSKDVHVASKPMIDAMMLTASARLMTGSVQNRELLSLPAKQAAARIVYEDLQKDAREGFVLDADPYLSNLKKAGWE